MPSLPSKIAQGLSALTFLLVTLSSRPAPAQVCRWQGTGPVCSGACGAGESEQTRARIRPRPQRHGLGCRHRLRRGLFDGDEGALLPNASQHVLLERHGALL